MFKYLLKGFVRKKIVLTISILTLFILLYNSVVNITMKKHNLNFDYPILIYFYNLVVILIISIILFAITAFYFKDYENSNINEIINSFGFKKEIIILYRLLFTFIFIFLYNFIIYFVIGDFFLLNFHDYFKKIYVSYFVISLFSSFLFSIMIAISRFLKVKIISIIFSGIILILNIWTLFAPMSNMAIRTQLNDWKGKYDLRYVKENNKYFNFETYKNGNTERKEYPMLHPIFLKEEDLKQIAIFVKEKNNAMLKSYISKHPIEMKLQIWETNDDWKDDSIKFYYINNLLKIGHETIDLFGDERNLDRWKNKIDSEFLQSFQINLLNLSEQDYLKYSNDLYTGNQEYSTISELELKLINLIYKNPSELDKDLFFKNFDSVFEGMKINYYLNLEYYFNKILENIDNSIFILDTNQRTLNSWYNKNLISTIINPLSQIYILSLNFSKDCIINNPSFLYAFKLNNYKSFLKSGGYEMVIYPTKDTKIVEDFNYKIAYIWMFIIIVGSCLFIYIIERRK